MKHFTVPVQKAYKQLKLFSNGYSLAIPSIVAFLICFVLSFVSGSLIIQPQGTKAITGLGLVTDPTMSLTSSGNVSLPVTPTSAGALASGSHNLTANTNVPTGYTLTLATTTISTLLTTTGTFASPTALTNNTWGYALAGAGNFDVIYATPTPNATSKWANPSEGATIKSTTSSVTSDNTTIYYGAKVDTNQASGTYLNTVRYTAIANISTIPAPTIASITPNSGTTAGGTVITIVGTGFTVNDKSVITGVTIGGAACANVSISSNTPTIGQDTIYCDTPVHPTAATVDVAVTTWKSTAVLASGYTYAAPTATITAPTGHQIFDAGTTSTNLTVTTDYPATCYYGSSANPITGMVTPGTTNHIVTLTGLTNASINTRYVRCQAATGHSYGTEERVTFYVRTATPAVPTLTPANGATVNLGTTIITTASSGATCTWGTSSTYANSNASGTTRTTTTGTNTLYYSCTAGSGNTAATPKTGSWRYIGSLPYAGLMQAITTASCPIVLSYANDARDNASYLVQKLADGKCWMLTNLAYEGGGTNTYGDIKSITEGSGGSTTYTTANYYIPTRSNRTTGTTNPSTSTNGLGQYGYLYNWCAAMGVQTSTSACTNSTTPTPNTSISICPSGWRLPGGGATATTAGNDFGTLNAAVNSSDTSSPSGLLSTWFGAYSGFWRDGFFNQGSHGLGYYWSSTQYSAMYAYFLTINSGYVHPGTSRSNYGKSLGLAVRCIAV